jgi:hypothetical protein
MFREGPFPAFLHGLVEYVAGGLFIALPLVLGYDSGAATAVSIVVGVVLIAVAASTDWGLSLNNQIPKAVHFAIDWILAGVLIASPFLFGFSGEDTPTAIFIAAGVLHLLLTIGTRFGQRPADRERQTRSKSSSSKVRAAADDEQRRIARPGEAPAAPLATDATSRPPEPPPTGDRRGARRT